jgi:hypothetical protein
MILLKDLLPYRNKQVKLHAALHTSGNMLRKKIGQEGEGTGSAGRS